MRLTEWGSSMQNEQLKNVITNAASCASPSGSDDFAEWLSVGLRDGRQFRPYLFLAHNGQLQDTEPSADKNLLAIAASIELLHQASLIVDDATDEHSQRGESRKALHVKLGHGIAATYSHVLVAASGELIMSTDIDPEEKLAVLRLMTRTKIAMALGQFADVFLSEKPDGVSWVDWCLKTAYLKTSALMSVPFEATGIIRGYSTENCERLRRSGEALGVAYQVADDIRDIEPREGPLILSLGFAHLLDTDPRPAILGELLTKKRINQADVAPLQQLLGEERDTIVSLATNEIDRQSQVALALPSDMPGGFATSEVISLARKIVADAG